MLHETALTLLNPLERDGFSPDPQLEGTALDLAAVAAAELLQEIYPSGSTILLDKWEALLEIVPPAGATVPARQAMVVYWLNNRGDTKKPYYVALAAALGFTIRIDDYIAPIIGFFAVGDMLVYEEWQEFSAGVSGAGDSLGMESSPALLPACWLVVVLSGPTNPAPELEALLLDRAPAHIHLNFIYV